MPYGSYGGFYFDPFYLVFTIPAAVLVMWAQWRVQSAYEKWSKVRNNRNLTGVEVAGVLLPKEQLGNVQVETVAGKLSDHYDPQSNILRLSQEIASQPTIASMAVAAHEIGSAEQDRDNYSLLRVRSGIVPFVQFGSGIGYLVFFGGLLLQIPLLAWIGIAMFSGGAIFALVTLPVELDASNRALRMLNDNGLLQSGQEYAAAKDMLSAAALTYVAAAAQALLTVLYYVFILVRSNTSQRDTRR